MVLSSGAVCDVHGGAPPTRVLSTCCGGAVCGAGGAPPTRTTRWAVAVQQKASHASIFRLPSCSRAAPRADRASSLVSVVTLASAVRGLARLIETLAVHGRNVHLSHVLCSTKRFDRAAT